MEVYLNELPDEVREDLPRYLRLKKIKKGVEVDEHLFQVAIADTLNSKAYLAGSVALKVNKKKKEIKWDIYCPNASVFPSRDDSILPKGGGIGVYVHALSLLSTLEDLDKEKAYLVCGNKNTTPERLGQMARLGLRMTMPCDENLGVVLKYIEENRGVKVRGVSCRNDIYKFLLD